MVSVCMVSYNGEKYIKQQIDSILLQLDSNDELIISDDGSLDRTIEIIESINDNRIKLYKHNSNRELYKMKLGGYRLVAQNFENAITHANGNKIFLSDQDDIWALNRVAEMSKALNEYAVVLCNYSVIDMDGNKTGTIGYPENKMPVRNSFIYNILRSRFMCCCMAFNKDMLQYILPFPAKLMSCDQWIGSLSTLVGGCKYINETLHYYRRHESNVSATTKKSPNSLFFKLYFRFYMFTIVLYRFISGKFKK